MSLEGSTGAHPHDEGDIKELTETSKSRSEDLSLSQSQHSVVKLSRKKKKTLRKKKKQKEQRSVWNKFSRGQMKQWGRDTVKIWIGHSHGGKQTPEMAETITANMERELTASKKFPTLGSWLLNFTEADMDAVGVPKDSQNKFLEYIQRLASKVSSVTVQRAFRRHLGKRLIEKEKANEDYRANVAKEILSTEEKYNEQLGVMVDLFYKPVCARTDILSQQEIKAIFSDVDIIKSVSDSLLHPLKERVLSWSKTQKLGDVFLMISDYLRVYSEYVKGYAHALTIVSKFDRSHPFTKFYASQIKKAPESYALFQLQSFLIIPVQRIPRYKLLLNDLLKHTSSSYLDYNDLVSATEKISETATWVNESQRKSESQEKVVFYQESIIGLEENIVNVKRRFVYEQEVYEIVDKKKEAKLMLALFNDIVIICEIKKDKYHFRSRFKVDRIGIKDVPNGEGDEKNCVEIKEVDEVFLLSSQTQSAKVELLEALHDTVSKRLAVLREQEEQIDRVAAPKAAAAAAILSSHYKKLKSCGATRSLSMSGCNLEDAEKKTFFNMTPEEKWKIANEARDALKSLTLVSELNEALKSKGIGKPSSFAQLSACSSSQSASVCLSSSSNSNSNSVATASTGCGNRSSMLSQNPIALSTSLKFSPKQVPQRYGSRPTSTDLTKK